MSLFVSRHCVSSKGGTNQKVSVVGIDPISRKEMSPLLRSMSLRSGPQIMLALQPDDEVPAWISHIAYLGPGCTIKHIGTKEDVFEAVKRSGDPINLGQQRVDMWRNFKKDLEEEDADLAGEDMESQESAPEESQEMVEFSSGPSRWDRIDDLLELKHQDNREPLVEMNGIKVSYGDRHVLGNWQNENESDTEKQQGLWWSVNRSERWAIFGPNGT